MKSLNQNETDGEKINDKSYGTDNQPCQRDEFRLFRDECERVLFGVAFKDKPFAGVTDGLYAHMSQQRKGDNDEDMCPRWGAVPKAHQQRVLENAVELICVHSDFC